jgi:2-polyprenyl-6-methoxyphenol hydroxylase-like FAD-dependent oxidoreductase
MEVLPMIHDVVIVGGGIAGLTSAAYIAKSGRTVIVLEKEDTSGGLVNSFDFKGFRFDGGIRAIENSGIVDSMSNSFRIPSPSESRAKSSDWSIEVASRTTNRCSVASSPRDPTISLPSWTKSSGS